MSALFYAAAVWLIVISSSQVAPAWLSDRHSIQFVSSLMMLLAISLMRSAARPPADNRFDQLWFDFFDTFGIVWGRRIQDRINYLSDKETWGTRLDLEGFTRKDITISLGELRSRQPEFRASQSSGIEGCAPEVESRMEHTFRWLLRRFVNSSWIDDRLGCQTQDAVRLEVIDS